jgi:glycosyltransferase involved in cell wall biosynthesis
MKTNLEYDITRADRGGPAGASMKLIIQIPCYNEEGSLPLTLSELPRKVSGFDTVEWLVIDDGSTDRTSEVARAHGVDHIARHPSNRGLARAFMTGIEAALREGADVVVNTDADNQYRALCIPSLVAPILAGRTQIVVGARPISNIPSFSPLKKLLQRLGSWTVRIASNTQIPDATSGFRAYHREAALQLYVLDSYTYTLETIIQAGRKGIPIEWVPVEVNGELRPSRLVTSTADYVRRSLFTIVRIFIIYQPLRFFTVLAALLALPGLAGIVRFLVYYGVGEGAGHIQSLVISGALIGSAAIVQMGGLLADIVSANRRLLEDIRTRQLRTEIQGRARKNPKAITSREPMIKRLPIQAQRGGV